MMKQGYGVATFIVRLQPTWMSYLVHFYNQRGESSENRIKELRSDFAAARLPCGDFHANAAWLMLSSMAYNLFA